ncbi:DUF1501 domain-containing protein [Streptomyces sp. NPDC047123]|uniref:DUF1501 domain-containing protein n=1 Tax=Streptomyces sp. NPDC047123 TaxID=3155622 RepID=UPI0033F2FF52
MDTWTRRKFLTTSGVAGGVALAAGATAWQVDDLLATGDSAASGTDAATLVLVTLYGGNDGLNTVVPAADGRYQDLRGDLAYSEEDVLPLGEGLGLNPSMKGLKRIWDDDRLAVVRGVSYPKPDHSHFRSMAIWQTASPKGPVPSGWLGRWLDHEGGGEPLKGVSIGATLPPLMAGETTAGAAVRLGRTELPAAWRHTCTQLADVGEEAHPLLRRAGTSLADLTEVTSAFAGDAEQQRQDPGEPRDDDEGNDGSSAGGQGGLGAQLDVVARAIEAGVPTRAYSVSLGGFDTHANEKATQTRLLGELDSALSAFYGRVGRTGAGRRVVVAVYSEFGRRPKANANQGTDHGTAGPLFVLGEPVKGGFYGEQPGLKDLTSDDLRTTTDFRDVYATLLGGVLDTDPAKILDGHDTTLDFV